MHGSSRRSAGALLFHAGQERRRQASRHDRGALADRDASGAARLDGSGRAAVRLLPIGAGDERRRASRPQTEAHRRGHRRGDARKSLPLRHVSIGPRGGAARGGAVRRAVMSTRRAFLKTSAAATGGLLIGVYFPDVAGEAVLDAQFGPPGGGAITPHAFIRIGTDDLVTLTIHKPDNGQGTETSIAQILAEELDCDWSRIRTEFAPINAALYGGALQGTFGSLAIRTTYDPMRRTGAAARDMLMQAAAARWGVDKSQCRTENGTVVNSATNARLSYGSLAEAAAKLPVPSNVTLKDPAQFRLIGKPLQRVDTPAKVTGKATLGIDVRLPGMLYAVVARCPVFGGTVARFEAAKARVVPGVQHVVQIPQGIAVVASNTWAAMEGRRALQIEWDEGPNAKLTSAGIRETLIGLTKKSGGGVAEQHGDVTKALTPAAGQIEATYEAP